MDMRRFYDSLRRLKAMAREAELAGQDVSKLIGRSSKNGAPSPRPIRQMEVQCRRRRQTIPPPPPC